MLQFLTGLLYILIALTSVFLICLVLIQRGKGGGLAGAFGGAGGSSAFGTKAGDVFTRVTMISAGIWIALNMLLVVLSNQRPSAWANAPGKSSKSDFIPSKATDLNKVGTPGESLDAGSGMPPLPPGTSTGTAPTPVSKGTPDATLLLPPSPTPPAAPSNKP